MSEEAQPASERDESQGPQGQQAPEVTDGTTAAGAAGAAPTVAGAAPTVAGPPPTAAGAEPVTAGAPGGPDAAEGQAGPEPPAAEATPAGATAAEPAPADAAPPDAAPTAAPPPTEAAPAEAATEAATEPPPEAQAEEAPAEADDLAVQVEDIGGLKRRLTITVPGGRIEAKRNELFGDLMRSAQVPGFRVGRAPRRLVERRFAREVTEDVRNALVGESLGKAADKVKLTVMGEPKLDLDAIELPEKGDMSYSVEVEVAPEFELPTLKGIPIQRPKVEITEARVDEALNRLRVRDARYEDSEGPAEAWDVVEATARLHGEGIAEVTRDVTLRVAPGQIEGLPLVDLGKDLAGKKVGESLAMTTQASDLHPDEAWRGRDIRIDLTIRELRKRTLPEVNDEYAQRYGATTAAELRQAVRDRIERQAAMEVQSSMRQQVRNYLLERAMFDLPRDALVARASRVLTRRYVDMLQRGIPQEEIDARLAEMQTSAVRQAEDDLRLSLVFQKIGEDRQAEVDDEELNARVASIARHYDRRPERLRQELQQRGVLEEVREAIREEKLIDGIIEGAVILELSADDIAKREAEERAAAEEAERQRVTTLTVPASQAPVGEVTPPAGEPMAAGEPPPSESSAAAEAPAAEPPPAPGPPMAEPTGEQSQQGEKGEQMPAGQAPAAESGPAATAPTEPASEPSPGGPDAGDASGASDVPDGSGAPDASTDPGREA